MEWIVDRVHSIKWKGQDWHFIEEVFLTIISWFASTSQHSNSEKLTGKKTNNQSKLPMIAQKLFLAQGTFSQADGPDR